MRDEDTVLAVAHDISIAGDFACDHGRAGRKCFGQHHSKALSAKRRRAEQVGLREQPLLLSVVNDAGDAHTCRFDQKRLDIILAGADDHQFSVNVVAQPFEGGEKDRQAFPFNRLPDEYQLQLP
uniref:Unannotated protein n=1 Tax=freshwater metagenome TaxID=449393 RepID=A0A6J6A0G1_9ZZZZ